MIDDIFPSPITLLMFKCNPTVAEVFEAINYDPDNAAWLLDEPAYNNHLSESEQHQLRKILTMKLLQK